MLKDEPLEYQLEQYNEKNDVLEAFGEPVSAVTLYENIYEDLDIIMPVVIIDEDERKHIVKMTIDEAITQTQGRSDMLLGGSTYFREFISKATAKDIYALIIDMDNVYSGVLQRALQNDWKLATGEPIPKPTYIANTGGTGLHLYFVFDRPLPYYKSQAAEIDRMYRSLAVMETTKRVYLPAKPSVQWFGQDFRMVGGCGKNGWENKAYRIGERWSPDDLASAVGLKNVHFVYDRKRRIATCKKGRANQKRGGYRLNRAVYDTSVRRCISETHEGNRYMSMCALSVLAWKCNVPVDQLEQDLLFLVSGYNKGATHLIREREVYSAMKMYNEKALLTPRVRTEDWLGWDFNRPRRNGQKQADHLEEARAIRDIRQKRKGTKWTDGNGRPSAQSIVQEWRQLHPDGKPKDCIAGTGLSKNTVYKWW